MSTLKKIMKEPWAYSIGLSLAALASSQLNAFRQLRSSEQKTNAIIELAKTVKKTGRPIIIKNYPDAEKK